ncbi:family 16 glycoside hydrolase [Bifidobacterium avesanii]|uniref:galactosylceramidase n=1 Tax=Bifidobacterium avesanii TaxID=1798157 RepID=A0A7K3TKT6_9BIFI|nr:family 16 glycoside hydrolase [Bifidobacterium avesanii]KAB8290925.1 glycoside hydrolase [Bifidobacterium avesanii]NEG78883.1 DUF1080 domain-containing protein [Bifidobacterium avesanii]
MNTGNDSFRKRGGGGAARSLSRKATVAVAALAMFAPFVVSGTAYAADAPIDVVVNGADVATAAKSVNGLTFKGFGVLSANSTSSLLMDYKAQNPEAYWQMINVLFGGDNPIMNTVKIEMGNDQNTSTGPNAATMRSATEYPNVAHEPGFQLAADALKVNPNVKVSILRWRSPAWVKSNDDVYRWYKNTILAVYRQYGYMVDSVNPHINESAPDLNWTKQFSEKVKNDQDGFIGAGEIKDLDGNAVPAWSSDTEKELFHKIRTVISDEVSTGSFGDDMLSDPDLLNAVDIAGYHYNTADQGNNFKTLADQYDKEVWNSEAQATFSVTADRPNNTMDLGSGEGNGTNNGQNDGTSGTGIGGINSALEMANTYVKGFTSSRRTNFVYQPAISAFYDGFQYSSKEVITMHDPWSGAINWDGALAVLEQVSRFAKTGYDTANNNADIWRGIPNASRSDITDGNPPGRGSSWNSSRGGATSYMTLAAPDASDFSTVIVNDSQYTKTYRIKAEDMNLGDDQTMELWETRAADEGQAYDANYVKPFAELTPGADGYYEFQVKPWSIVTATTLDDAVKGADGTLTARDGKGSQVPSNKEYVEGQDYAVLDTDESGKKNGVTDDSTLYADDYEYTGKTVESYDPKTGKMVTEDFLKSRGGDTGATPLYTNDTNGAFEVVKTADGNHVLRQQVGPGMAYGSWNGGAWNGGDPVTTLGDYRWTNYKVSVDVLFEADAGNATVGARQWGNSSNGKNDSPAQLRVTPDGSWDLMRFGTVLQSGKASDIEGVNFKTGANQWNNIAVQVLGDVYTAYINGVEVASYTDPQPQANGRVQLGSTFNFVQFDNLKVETVDGATPYYTDLLDNMHQRSWDDNSTALLTYNEKWQHLNGQGMYVYKRSVSNSTGKGATLTYTFDGTGIDLLGANNGAAKLNVTVDGTQIAASAPTIASDNGKPTTYELRGLKNGKHTVTFETADDNAISIDAVGVVKATDNDSAKVDTKALSDAIDSYADLSADEWNPDTWAVFAANLAEAKAALADPAGYGLDAEGAAAIVARLATARQNLVDKYISPEIKQLGLTGAVAKGADLPKTVTVDGKESAVTWDATAAEAVSNAGDYTQATITGVTDDKIDGTYRYRVSATVEVLPSLNIEYFIDSGVTGADGSPEYNAVKAAIPSLRNAVADQKAGDWGYSGNSVIKGGADVNDKYATGLYANGQTLTYTLPLEAGSYNLTAGFTEWWTGENRPMKLQVTWTEDGQTKTVDGSQLASIGTAGRTSSGNVSFTLAADATVTFNVLANGGKDPVISWLAVEKQPVSLGTVAAVAGDALPKTVSYDGADVPVAWNTDSVAAFAAAEPYDTLTLAGQATVNGKEQTVKATVEVIPDGLTYYIDSGTNGADSPQYTAVKNAVELKNDKVDQVSESADQWGYVKDGVNVKGSTDINDKYSTGLWQSNAKQIYRLPLEAGTYTLTGGFAEWWGKSRNMYQTVNVDGNELAKGSIALSGSNTPLKESLTFKLDKAATVEYVVTNEGAGGEKPVISWLAVAAKQVADKTVLKAAVDAAATRNEADYTADSWKAFAAALKIAQDLLANEDAAQSDVDAAVAALFDAEAKLVEAEQPAPTVNKDVLNALLAAAGKLAEKDYTADSWKPFSEALAAAKKVAADDAAAQADVDAAVAALAKAQGELVAAAPEPEPTPVDKTSLNAVVKAAEGVDLSGYTEDSAKAFSEALAAAKKVAADDAATQTDVNAALEALVKAQAGLTVKPAEKPEPTPADRTALGAAVASAGKLAEADYTAASWKPFAAALAAAKAVPADADQAAVNKASADLVKAQSALVKLLKVEGLKAAIDSAGKLAEKDYTADSWKPFSEALAAAKDTLAAAEAFNGDGAKARAAAPTQADVDNAVKTLVKAQGELVKVAPEPTPEPEPTPGTVDKTALKAVVDAAAKLAEKDYTADSWKAFASALKSANDVLANDKATQQQVSDAASALLDAAAGLAKPAAAQQRKPDKTVLQALVDAAAAAQEKDYTAASWKAFSEALAAAKNVLAADDATQQQIADAGKALFQAYGALAKPAATPETPDVQPGNGEQDETEKGEGAGNGGDNTVSGNETVDTNANGGQSGNTADQSGTDKSGQTAGDQKTAQQQSDKSGLASTGAAVAGVAALALIAAASGVVLTLARRRRD